MNSDPPESDSDHSSAPSRSSSPTARQSSPAAPPTLARLISHFLSAKRSLNSATFVYRANELVTVSRALVEEIAVLNARNSYSSGRVRESVDVLVSVRNGIAKDGQAAGSEFEKVIQRLDVANERLEKTLADLRQTRVDRSLQQQQSDENDADEDAADVDAEHESSNVDVEEQKSLYAFIDSSTHEQLRASLRKDIDDWHSSNDDLSHTLNTFHESLDTISGLLHPDDERTGPNKSPLYNLTPPPIPDLFSGMVEHATAMASLLGNLVQHYDLSVTALKHTEGGGEAAKRAIQQAGADETSPVAMEESLYVKTAPQPISTEERDEMLHVLENDAEQVEDVVSELRDRNREQEDLFSQLSEHAHAAKQTDARLREILTMLHEMRDLHLPAHLHGLKSYRQSWQRIRSAIEDKTDDLLGLAASNENFLRAYAELLREVERRNSVQSQMRKVADKANRELRKLWERDREGRRGFLDEFGAFLPQGIWARADEGGGLWEIREVDG
jgi:autophagy-related protein 17